MKLFTLLALLVLSVACSEGDKQSYQKKELSYILVKDEAPQEIEGFICEISSSELGRIDKIFYISRENQDKKLVHHYFAINDEGKVYPGVSVGDSRLESLTFLQGEFLMGQSELSGKQSTYKFDEDRNETLIWMGSEFVIIENCSPEIRILQS